MRPKPTPVSRTPVVELPTTSSTRTTQLPDAHLTSGRSLPPGESPSRGAHTSPFQGTAQHSAGETLPPSIVVSDTTALQPQTSSPGNDLSSYLLNHAMAIRFQGAEPNDDGLHYLVNRAFAELEEGGVVPVEFDAQLGAYRAMDFLWKRPPGPALYRNPGKPTWSPEDPAFIQQPRSDRATAPHNESLTVWDPGKFTLERLKLLQRYNLTATQHLRLQAETAHGPMPEWAEQHKRLTLDKNNPQRFELIAAELEPYILELRNRGDVQVQLYPELRYSRDFLDDYLHHAGYQRNVHNALYRTDIPAMFRGETRLPFELARDERMIYRHGNSPGTTTKRGLSSTFSLKDAVHYAASKGGQDYELNYNSQANLYPGISPDEVVTYARNAGNDSDSDSSFIMDDSQDYPAARLKQTLEFIYIIDTRGIEVVPRAENEAFNSVFKNPPNDLLEGQISIPTRGISAERIWLVKSDLSRAVRVKDIYDEAGYNADEIEQATWAGENQHTRMAYRGTTPVMLNVYDSLIDRVAASGGTVLELPKGQETFANDIIWPIPEHYRP